MDTTKKKNSVIMALSAGIGAIIGIVLVNFTLRTCNNFTPSIEKQLINISNEHNKNCPYFVDSETRLDNTNVLPNKTLQYNYTLPNITKEEAEETFSISDWSSNILNFLKSQPDLEYLRSQGVTFNYSYRDKDGIFFHRFSFTPEDYK